MRTSDETGSVLSTGIDRRRLLTSALWAGGGLSLAALVGCGGDDDDDDGAPAQPGAATQGAQRTEFPARTAHSRADVQKIAEEHHWSKVRPVTMPASQTPDRGGVAVLSAASFGLQTLHPTDEPVGQWPFCFTHSNLLGMDFSHSDTLPITTQYSVSQSYEVADQTTVVFRLRPNVTWHNKPPANGAPVTADDVRATYDFFKASRLHGSRFAEIERFDEPEKGVVRLKLTKPASHMINLLRVPQFAILNARHIDEGAESLRTKAIGSGPFTQEKFQPNQARVYKKNPSYWLKDKAGNQLPYSDGVVHQIIQDPAAALAAFRTKRVDAYKPTSVEQFDQLRKELDVFAQVHPVFCTCSSTLMAFSHRDQLFKDVRVRRAFSLAVNRQDMIETLFGGAASMNGFISFPYQGLPWPRTISEMGQWHKHDPAAARQLLDAAGVQRGVTVPILYSGQVNPGTGAAVGNVWVESLRRDWKQVGVELKLEPQDALGFNRVHYGGQWNGLSSIGVGGATSLDADAFLRFVETGSALNASGASDPNVDRLIAKYRAEYKTEEQYKIAREIESYVVDDQVLLGIHVPINFGLILWQKHLRNVIDTPHWWITGGAGQEFTEMWLEKSVPSRNIDSF